MIRMFFIRLNLDEISGDLFRFTDDRSIAEWTRGLNIGARGYPPMEGASQPWMAGHAMGAKAYQEAAEFHQQKSDQGKIGAKARWRKDSLAMAEPCLSHAEAMAEPLAEPCLSQCLSNNEHPTESNHKKEIIKEIKSDVAEATPTPSPVRKRKAKVIVADPTEDECIAHAHEMGYQLDASHFFNYYAASKWYRGNTKIRDWKIVMADWERRESTRGSNSDGFSRRNSDRPSAKTSDPTDIGEDEYIGRGQRYIDRLHATAPTEEEFRAMFPTWAAEIDRDNAAKKAKAEQEVQKDA